MKMRNVSFKISTNHRCYAAWDVDGHGVEYAYTKEGNWCHYGTIYRSENELVLSEDCLVEDNGIITVGFLENIDDKSQLHFMRLEKGEWDHDTFDLEYKSTWVGLINHRTNYDLPLCSSSSSSSYYASSSSSFQSDVVVDGDNYVVHPYAFVFDIRGMASCYVYNYATGELINTFPYTSTSYKRDISNVKMAQCGNHCGISYVLDDVILYNFYSFFNSKWRFGNFAPFVQSAPYGNATGKHVLFSINGYELDGFANMPIAWTSKDDGGNMILKGATITNGRHEWPLDLVDHTITMVPKERLDLMKWEGLAMVQRSTVPQILFFGDSIRKLHLVKEGTWKAENLDINGWTGYVKNRKSQAYLWNNTIHVVFRDDSGLYYFSDQEKQLHKLSE